MPRTGSLLCRVHFGKRKRMDGEERAEGEEIEEDEDMDANIGQ